MNLFAEIKDQVTAKDAAIHYGFDVGRNGMMCCPFHDDKHPSMKVDEGFYCFGCGAKGDVIEFVAKLYELSSKDAAQMLIDDLGLIVSGKKKRKRNYKRVRTKRRRCEEKLFEQAVERAFIAYVEYLHLLRSWEEKYSPKCPDDEWHPLFVEAAQKKDYVEYLLDILMYGTKEEKAELLNEKAREVIRIEQRIRGLTSGDGECISDNECDASA